MQPDFNAIYKNQQLLEQKHKSSKKKGSKAGKEGRISASPVKEFVEDRYSDHRNADMHTV